MIQELPEDHNKANMKTLTSCMEVLQKQGFNKNFMVNENGLYEIESERVYNPEEVRIPSFYRFEGDSDPADSSILYAIETEDGLKGLLSDSYGPYSDPEVAKFITEVQEINKKTNRGEKL